MLSNPAGDTNTLFEPTKSLGTAIPRTPMQYLSKDELREIAFHNAEERMLELRLTRRYKDPVRGRNEAREMIRGKIEAILTRRETEKAAPGRVRNRSSRG